MRLAATWVFAPRNVNYGVSGVFCNFAGRTTPDDDLRVMALDVIHPELVEPVIGATGKRFFFPEAGLRAFVTGGVTYLLPRLVGLARACEIILLGEKSDV